MKKVKIIILFIIMISTIFITTGCTIDDMDDISIIVTNYPNEFIVDNLYSKHSTIKSIYPDGVKIDEYKISSKQKHEYANYDLFIYNGLIDNERSLAVELLDINPNLKIIDTAYVLETEYSPEELWLNPSSLLMMAQNIRIGLKEFTSSTILNKDIDEAYNTLKISLSELDADYRLAAEDAENKEIVVADSALKYLEKFNFEVYCIDADASNKTIDQVNQLIQNKQISYIYYFEGDKLNKVAQQIKDNNKDIKEIKLHKLNNLTDEQRKENEDYISIMRNNLKELNKELYQ